MLDETTCRGLQRNNLLDIVACFTKSQPVRYGSPPRSTSLITSCEARAIHEHRSQMIYNGPLTPDYSDYGHYMASFVQPPPLDLVHTYRMVCSCSSCSTIEPHTNEIDRTACKPPLIAQTKKTLPIDACAFDGPWRATSHVISNLLTM